MTLANSSSDTGSDKNGDATIEIWLWRELETSQNAGQLSSSAPPRRELMEANMNEQAKPEANQAHRSKDRAQHQSPQRCLAGIDSNR